MTNQADIKSDTLTLLLAYHIHSDLPMQARAVKIMHCCQQIRDRTHDTVMFKACDDIIHAVSQRKFRAVMTVMKVADRKYAHVFKD